MLGRYFNESHSAIYPGLFSPTTLRCPWPVNAVFDRPNRSWKNQTSCRPIATPTPRPDPFANITRNVRCGTRRNRRFFRIIKNSIQYTVETNACRLLLPPAVIDRIEGYGKSNSPLLVPKNFSTVKQITHHGKSIKWFVGFQAEKM